MPEPFASFDDSAPRPGAPGPPAATEPPASKPHAAVPWPWLCLLAPLVLLAHSLGAPLGQPVAEDFDFLHHALFSPFDLLDGGGSVAFWRPIPHQLYYRALAPVILGAPGVVAALHLVLLGVSSLLIFRAFRRAWPPAWAAVIATFLMLSESTRTLVAWPSHFVDLGVWLFTAIVLHEAAARRLKTALVALLLALLCKEVAVVAALLVPWLPGIGPGDRRERLRWAAAMGGVALAWGAACGAIRHGGGFTLPHGLDAPVATVLAQLPQRLAWAAGNSLRAYLSLPASPSPLAAPLGAAAVALAAIAGGLALVRRGRDRASGPAAQRLPSLGTGTLALWGLAWFLVASATMAPIFPMWMPNRSGYGGLGLAVLAVALLGGAHRLLPGALVGLRLVAFAMSPGPPALVDVNAPQRGAFLDFERLVRLQRFVRATHAELGSAHPTLPRGALVGRHLVPLGTMYAFGEDRALHVWYRDTTLRWLPFGDLLADTAAAPVTIVEYQQGAARPVALVSPDAMRAVLHGADRITRHEWAAALADLDRADSLQYDRGAGAFLGIAADRRALALAALGENARAEREARNAIRLWPPSVDARYVLARLWAGAGRFDAAVAQLDTLLAIAPADSGAARLRRQIHEVAGQRLGVAAP